MFDKLVRDYHLHPIIDHFTIALLAFGIGAELLAAAAAILPRGRTNWRAAARQALRSTSLILVVAGAAAAILSYLSGDAEADRLWDTMSPGAQQLLAGADGPASYLSHAVLGQYLMYAFLFLAAWRVLIEFSARLSRWRIAFLAAAALAVAGLLYQGKTGGELVYQYGVGTTSGSRPAPNAAIHGGPAPLDLSHRSRLYKIAASAARS
ncbi:MAG TPA: DUF2231 domain-containing protein [Candidatus Binataceae bacterium]|nr:DUF2231 domain-containing protein [Candidatus Binataceae bacterium]